jgi:hypothetical protein
MPKKSGSPLKTLFSTTMALAATWIAYSQLKINHRLPLPRALDADRETFIGDNTGLISYYADRSGSGRPLVLITASTRPLRLMKCARFSNITGANVRFMRLTCRDSGFQTAPTANIRTNFIKTRSPNFCHILEKRQMS